MTSKDDRLEFEAHKREMALALGKDEDAFQHALNTLIVLDKYDYAYLWSWMGVPIIQMPADVMATQEVVWNTKPDVIIETGVARGGSMIFMASLLKVIGKGKVVGVDIDIRAHNRDSIEKHPLSPLITLIEGPSTTTETLAKVRAEIPAGASVMVVLDSDHGRDHVLEELRCYGPLVTQGQYIVVADTVLGRADMSQTPTKRSKIWYPGDEPYAAVNTYLKETDRFETDEALNSKLVLSSSPGGYLKCIGK
jgi:cephalosporin hydroxylase